MNTAPDWPPQISAIGLAKGEQRHGSTGQLFEARNGQWVRIAEQPKVTDNDRDEITVSLDGKELRGWSYADDSERRQKMLQAREYVEGWCDGREARQ